MVMNIHCIHQFIIKHQKVVWRITEGRFDFSNPDTVH